MDPSDIIVMFVRLQLRDFVLLRRPFIWFMQVNDGTQSCAHPGPVPVSLYFSRSFWLRSDLLAEQASLCLL